MLLVPNIGWRTGGVVIADSARYLRLQTTAYVDTRYLVIGEIKYRVGGTTIVPTLTNYTSGGVTVLYSKDPAPSSIGRAWNAFDGTVGGPTSGMWLIDGRVNPEFITVDFGVGGFDPSALDDYQIAPRGSDGQNYVPTAWELAYSDDNSTWTTLDAQSGVSSGWTAGTYRTFPL